MWVVSKIGRYVFMAVNSFNTLNKLNMNSIILRSLTSVALLSTSSFVLAQNSKDVSTKAAVTSSTNAATAHFWYDGAERKLLAMDSDRVVRFQADGKASVLAKAFSQEKSVLKTASETESPLFIENGRRRALPGGLIVSLKQARDEQDAREQLVARGLTPVRLIPGDAQARNWIVASPTGLETLNMANRLHESGHFASVAPNWWTELQKK
jgi:hypothetical protein